MGQQNLIETGRKSEFWVFFGFLEKKNNKKNAKVGVFLELTLILYDQQNIKSLTISTRFIKGQTAR